MCDDKEDMSRLSARASWGWRHGGPGGQTGWRRAEAAPPSLCPGARPDREDSHQSTPRHSPVPTHPPLCSGHTGNEQGPLWPEIISENSDMTTHHQQKYKTSQCIRPSFMTLFTVVISPPVRGVVMCVTTELRCYEPSQPWTVQCPVLSWPQVIECDMVLQYCNVCSSQHLSPTPPLLIIMTILGLH